MLSPNAVRFDPRAGRDHVESYFIKANDPSGEKALWLKATIFVSASEPDRVVTEAWAIAFQRDGEGRRHVAVRSSFGLAASHFGDGSLDVRVGPESAGLTMRPGLTAGALARQGHSVAWRLAYTGDERTMSPLPASLRQSPRFPKTKLLTPVPSALFSGEIHVDGDTWIVDSWPGMQGHNWGTRHADLYAWCHANQWREDPEFTLEGLIARVRVGPVRTPLVTLLSVRHRGVEYEFDHPVDILRTRGSLTLRSFTFSARSRHAKIEGSVEADGRDMVGLYYPNPSGPMTYCLNSKLAHASVRFEASGRPPLALTTSCAALEIGTHDDAHGVEMIA